MTLTDFDLSCQEPGCPQHGFFCTIIEKDCLVGKSHNTLLKAKFFCYVRTVVFAE